MNEKDTQADNDGTQATGNPGRQGRRRHRGLAAVTLLVAGGLVGAGLVTAVGVAASSGCGERGMSMGGMPGMQGMQGMPGDGGMHGGRHGDKPGKHMQRRVEYMLDEVDASPEQREKVTAMLDDMFTQMGAMRTEHGKSRSEMMAALTAAEIDRAALEQLRAQHVAGMEARSRLMVDGMANVAEVLTPEQRAEVAEHLRKHGPRH